MNSSNKNINILEKLLKESDEEAVVNRLVYKIPKKYLDFIKNNNLKFSQFVNEAIADKIKIIEEKDRDNGKK